MENPYIWDYKDVKWVCEDPNLEFAIIDYETPEEAEEQVGIIVKDGEVIDAVVSYGFNRTVEFYDMEEYYASLEEYGGIACEPIFIIKYEFKNDVPIASITKDKVFDGTYQDKEIQLEMIPIEE